MIATYYLLSLVSIYITITSLFIITIYISYNLPLLDTFAIYK